MAAPDEDYQSVLEELDATCNSFDNLVAGMDLDAIIDLIRIVTKQSSDQMEMLKKLKVKIESLNAGIYEVKSLEEQKEALQAVVASDKARIVSLETTIAEGGGNSKALTEEVKRLDIESDRARQLSEHLTHELYDARSMAENLIKNKNFLEAQLGESFAEVGMLKSLTEDLKNRLAEVENELHRPSLLPVSPIHVGGANSRSQTPLMPQSDVSYVSDVVVLPVSPIHVGGANSRSQTPLMPQTIPVLLIPHDPQVLLKYIKENVFIDGIDGLAKFKYQLTKERQKGIDLTEKSLIELIESLRNEPLKKIDSKWPHFPYTLETHKWWALDNRSHVSYEKIARDYLGL
jgi:hypothetical protein